MSQSETRSAEPPFDLQWLDRPEGAELVRRRFLAHKERCRKLPPVTAREAENLVREFLARRGGATRCPTAYLVPVR